MNARHAPSRSRIDPDLALDSLAPSLVGRLLIQLCLQAHRNASLRVWAIITVGLARLARAYGVPIPSNLAKHFAAEKEIEVIPLHLQEQASHLERQRELILQILKRIDQPAGTTQIAAQTVRQPLAPGVAQ